MSITLSPSAHDELARRAEAMGQGASRLATKIVLSALSECDRRLAGADVEEQSGDLRSPLFVDRGWCSLWVERTAEDGRILVAREDVNLARVARIRESGISSNSCEVMIDGAWVTIRARRSDLLDACRSVAGVQYAE